MRKTLFGKARNARSGRHARSHAATVATAAFLAMLGVACSSGGTNSLPTLGSPQGSPSGGGDGNSPGGTNPAPGTSPDNPGSGTSPAADAGTPTAPAGATTISASTTWSDGQKLTGAAIIAAGATVTVSPGATVSFASGATLTVNGTLTAASSSGTHATLTAMSGTWGGIVVGPGGTLSLDGADITNAATAIETQAGADPSTYDNGTITAAKVPFQVGKGTKLSTTHGTVTGTLGATAILGAFTASYLNYNSGQSEGIVAQDPSATLSIEDSTLAGAGPYGDMVVSAEGQSVHVAYTTITNVHCAFHFDNVNAFDISYVTADSDAYGAMLYGSNPAMGPFTISYSNFSDQFALDEQGMNGAIAVNNCYVNGQSSVSGATNGQSTPVANAGPR